MDTAEWRGGGGGGGREREGIRNSKGEIKLNFFNESLCFWLAFNVTSLVERK